MFLTLSPLFPTAQGLSVGSYVGIKMVTATCMKILFCVYPSLCKLFLSTLLLLNNAVLFVLPGYLTCLHKTPCIFLFLYAKLTEMPLLDRLPLTWA